MFRSTLIAAGALSLVHAALARQTLDTSRLTPLTAAPQYAGTYDYETKRWLPAQQASQLRASSLTVYDNTCTWTGAAYFANLGACEMVIDEGRIPGGIGGTAPPGATADNLINFFEIYYCTQAVTGTVDVEVGFWDNLGGGCLGGVPPFPVSTGTAPTAWFDFGAAAGFPLPGASGTPGSYGCWVVGVNLGTSGFCLKSDGDGVFDNSLSLDQFAWSFRMNNVLPLWNSQGVVLSGEPSTSPVGGCTYNIPCGTDYFSATDCGHGLDTEDIFWVNVDGDPYGPVSAGGCTPMANPGGTDCYWYGGYPSNPFSSVYMRMGSAGQCSGCTGSPTSYCTAGTTTNGCLGNVSMSGVPSTSSAAPCTITVANIEGGQQGIVFYGLAQMAQPWGNGASFLCVKSPLERFSNQPTGGASSTCTGSMSMDVNAYWATHPTSVGQPLYAGETFYFQGWFRDPPSPKTTNLSNGLQVSVCP